jgi:hypothetical protein
MTCVSKAALGAIKGLYSTPAVRMGSQGVAFQLLPPRCRRRHLSSTDVRLQLLFLLV